MHWSYCSLVLSHWYIVHFSLSGYMQSHYNRLCSEDNWYDDVIKWKHLPRYWRFVQGIHRSPVNSPHKGQWPGALMFSLICIWIYSWVNNHEAGDLRCYHAHYDVIVICDDPAMTTWWLQMPWWQTATDMITLEDITSLTHWPLGNFNDILDI